MKSQTSLNILNGELFDLDGVDSGNETDENRKETGKFRSKDYFQFIVPHFHLFYALYLRSKLQHMHKSLGVRIQKIC